jgi:hypothetical protein
VANSRLKLIAPVIAQHGVDYVINKFDQKLFDGTLTLALTRTWLRATIIKAVDNDVVTLHDLAYRDSSKNASYTTTLHAGVMDLISSRKRHVVTKCPEVLLLDFLRIDVATCKFNIAVVASSMLVIVGEKLRDRHVPNPAAILDNLSDKFFVSQDVTNITIFFTNMCKELENVPNIREDDLATLKTTLVQGVKRDRPIPTLMEKRIYNMILYALNVGDIECFAGDMTTDLVFRKFELPRSTFSLAPLFKRTVSSLRDMLAVIRKVHAPHFNSIIAGEAIGLIVSRVPFVKGQIIEVGFRLMTVQEVATRLNKLLKSDVMASPGTLRLNGGFVVREGPQWVVYAMTGDMLSTEALIVPISIDVITLAPGDVAPPGYRLVSYREASSTRWNVLLVEGWLQKWSIVRLEGGKLDGVGYGGKVTLGDFSDATYIGEALVTPV